MKHKFWYFVHNAIAHPLLILGFQWTDTFHDWSYDKMMESQNLKKINFRYSAPHASHQNLFNALYDLGVIATQDDMQQVIQGYEKDLNFSNPVTTKSTVVLPNGNKIEYLDALFNNINIVFGIWDRVKILFGNKLVVSFNAYTNNEELKVITTTTKITVYPFIKKKSIGMTDTPANKEKLTS